MATNLFLNYFIDKNADRQQELDFCIHQNILNNSIDNIILIVSAEDFTKMTIPDEERICIVVKEERPTYNDYFNLFIVGGINIISNLDIIIPQETIALLPNYFATPSKRCLALTRYDITGIIESSFDSVFFNRTDSQDTWVFNDAVPQIENANFTLGSRGCDNAIAHILEQNGYEVLNPSLTLKTYHYHVTNVRNYTQESPAVPPPYKLLPPTE